MSNNFKSTLEARRENMKAQSDRRSQFSGAGIPGDSQSSFMRSTVLFNDDQRAQNNDSSLIPLNQQFQGRSKTWTRQPVYKKQAQRQVFWLKI